MSVFFRLGLFCARRRWLVIGVWATRRCSSRFRSRRRSSANCDRAASRSTISRPSRARKLLEGTLGTAAVGDGDRPPEHERRASRRSGIRGRRGRDIANVPQAAHVAGLIPHTLNDAAGERGRPDRLRDRRAGSGAGRFAAGARTGEGRTRAHAGRDGDAGRRARRSTATSRSCPRRTCAAASSSRCRWPRSRCSWSSEASWPPACRSSWAACRSSSRSPRSSWRPQVTPHEHLRAEPGDAARASASASTTRC